MKIVALIELLAKALQEDPGNTEIMLSPTDIADLVMYNPEENHDLNWIFFDIEEENSDEIYN